MEYIIIYCYIANRNITCNILVLAVLFYNTTTTGLLESSISLKQSWGARGDSAIWQWMIGKRRRSGSITITTGHNIVTSRHNSVNVPFVPKISVEAKYDKHLERALIH